MENYFSSSATTFSSEPIKILFHYFYENSSAEDYE